MNAPRLEINLEKIYENARTLVGVLDERGIAVTGVTKASLGCAEIAHTLLRADVCGLGDSRIENIQAMKNAGVSASMTLIRSPMMSQVDRVIRYADISFNTELKIINELSVAALNTGQKHGVVLMVELGDLREGIMPADVEGIARKVLQLPNIELAGIGTNLACRSGVVPNAGNMAELSALANTLESTFGIGFGTISGGNSANLEWATSSESTGRINDLRLGESILLGREPLQRKPIPGLHTDAFTLVAEVIESKYKPSLPRGMLAQTAFGEQQVAIDRGTVAQSILALGRQDIDPHGLSASFGIDILDASSDHLMVVSANRLQIGSEVSFQLDYKSLLSAMTSPFIHKLTIEASDHGVANAMHAVAAA